MTTPQKQKDDARKARAEAKKRKESATQVAKWGSLALALLFLARVVSGLVVAIILGVGAVATVRWLLEAAT